jgi:hypothetical protein
LGGSTAFGYGPDWDGSFPYFLEQELNRVGQRRFSTVNLAYNNEGAYSYKFTLRDFEDLDYDVVVLYAGYNDLGLPNTQVYRHHSPIFQLTGYMPTLPLYLREKAAMIRSGGNMDALYEPDKVTFTPTPVASATAATLDAAEKIALSLERQVGRLVTEYEFESGSETLCPGDWAFFCRQMHDATALALSSGKRVVVATDPIMATEYARERQTSQQTALRTMIEQRFAGRPVRFVSMADAVDMTDRAMQLDGMHLTGAGNEKIAERLVEPVLDVLN